MAAFEALVDEIYPGLRDVAGEARREVGNAHDALGRVLSRLESTAITR
jgi:hypothetical protein